MTELYATARKLSAIALLGYADGKPHRQVTAKLNAAGILPLRGTKWSAPTIEGNAKRRHRHDLRRTAGGPQEEALSILADMLERIETGAVSNV